MSELPEGWAKASIKDLFVFKYGKGLTQENRNISGSVPVYGSNGVVGMHDAAITNGVTIIIGRKGSVGEVHISPDKCWPIDTTYYIDEFPCHLPPDYWALFLKSLQLGEQDKSSAIPGISREDIYQLEVPVPPLAEQRRIVAKLETLLGKVDACQQRLAKIPLGLKRFRQAVLAAACSGQLTADWREKHPDVQSPSQKNRHQEVVRGLFEIPENWDWETLESVCSYVVDCPHSTPKWAETGYICARTTNFKPSGLDLSEVRFVSEETYRERIERLTPMPGDILYSREGGILGIACIIPQGLELCLGQRMMLMRTSGSYLSPLLMYWLNSPEILNQVRDLTGGSASPHLNVRDIKSFPTPLPPLAEQQEIVHRVEAFFKLADQLEARYQKAKTQVDKLQQSILAKAFRGELVPTDDELARQAGREYESAAALLARVRGEKAAAGEAPKTSRRRSTAGKARDQ